LHTCKLDRDAGHGGAARSYTGGLMRIKSARQATDPETDTKVTKEKAVQPEESSARLARLCKSRDVRQKSGRWR